MSEARGASQVAPPLVLTATMPASPTTATPETPKVAMPLWLCADGKGPASRTHVGVAGADTGELAAGATVGLANARADADPPVSARTPASADTTIAPTVSLAMGAVPLMAAAAWAPAWAPPASAS